MNHRSAAQPLLVSPSPANPLPLLGARLLVAAAVLVVLAGCPGSRKPGDTASPQDPPADKLKVRTLPPDFTAETDPDVILRKLIAAYRESKSYRDEGVAVLSYTRGNQRFEDEAPLAVRWSAGKVAVRAYQAQLASDGQRMVVRVNDPASQNFDGQVVVRPAPAKLTLPALYQDAIVHEVLSQGLCRHPIQLELLLGADPLAEFFEDGIQRRLLESELLEDRPCYRIQLRTPNGDFVCWIDQQDLLLRRLEFPHEGLIQDPAITDVALRAEFRGAVRDGQLAESEFQLEIPPGAKQVQRFIAPPLTLPSELLGREVEAFAFEPLGPAGEPLTSKALRGKVVVVSWFRDHPMCEAALQQIEAVRQGLDDDLRANTRFIAVATESVPEAPAEQLRELLERWRVQLEPARDAAAAGKAVFGIDQLPSHVVIGADGRLQRYDVGFNPDYPRQLTAVLQALARGRDLASELRQRVLVETAAYRQELIDAGAGDVQPLVVPLPERTAPKRLRLEEVWRRELTQPGNLLVLPAGQTAAVAAIEGMRSVAELDAQGQVLQRRELELPEGASISFLRTGMDQGKRRFLAAEIMGKQAFLFDETFAPLNAFPAADVQHPGLRDALLLDLDRDDRLEIYLGYWGGAGTQRLDLNGKRIWSDRRCPTVQSLAVAPSGDALLAVGETGAIHQLSHAGESQQPVQVAQWPIYHLFSAEFAPDAATTTCGISYDALGSRVALGLDSKFREMWTYDLPMGTFEHQTRFVAGGKLAPDDVGHWVFAGPQGSVHVVSHDGQFHDFFYHGSKVRGLALLPRQEGGHLLLVADASGVSAFRLHLP